jgi:hypothetical protein
MSSSSPKKSRGRCNTPTSVSSTSCSVRAEALPAEQARARRIEEVRQAKEPAIEAQDFETASRTRDHERRLRQANEVMKPEVLQQIRLHVGLPTPTDDPPARS